jgi:hypothetical protein
MTAMNRRDFLADLARLSFLCAGIPNGWRVMPMPRAAGDPFMLGVASGDPTSTDVVIWTRLAPGRSIRRGITAHEPPGGSGDGEDLGHRKADDTRPRQSSVFSARGRERPSIPTGNLLSLQRSDGSSPVGRPHRAGAGPENLTAVGHLRAASSSR